MAGTSGAATAARRDSICNPRANRFKNENAREPQELLLSIYFDRSIDVHREQSLIEFLQSDHLQSRSLSNARHTVSPNNDVVKNIDTNNRTNFL